MLELKQEVLFLYYPNIIFPVNIVKKEAVGRVDSYSSPLRCILNKIFLAFLITIVEAMAFCNLLHFTYKQKPYYPPNSWI